MIFEAVGNRWEPVDPADPRVALDADLRRALVLADPQDRVAVLRELGVPRPLAARLTPDAETATAVAAVALAVAEATGEGPPRLCFASCGRVFAVGDSALFCVAPDGPPDRVVAAEPADSDRIDGFARIPRTTCSLVRPVPRRLRAAVLRRLGDGSSGGHPLPVFPVVAADPGIAEVVPVRHGVTSTRHLLIVTADVKDVADHTEPLERAVPVVVVVAGADARTCRAATQRLGVPVVDREGEVPASVAADALRVPGAARLGSAVARLVLSRAWRRALASVSMEDPERRRDARDG